MNKIKGVRFNTDTNTIEYDNDDGSTTPIDNPHKPSLLQRIAKKLPKVTDNVVKGAKIAGQLPLAVVPVGCGGTTTPIQQPMGKQYNPNLNFDVDDIIINEDGTISIWDADIPMRVNNELTSSLGFQTLGVARLLDNDEREIEINMRALEERDRDIRKTILHELIHAYFRHGHDATEVDPVTKCNTQVMATFNTDAESAAKCWGEHGDQMKQQYHDFHDKYGGFVDRERFDDLRDTFPNKKGWFTGTRVEEDDVANLVEVETDDDTVRKWVRPKRLYE